MSVNTHKHRQADEHRPTESTIDNQRVGRNSLQGDDQVKVRNERQSLPEERQRADDIEESFEKLDKDRRAAVDLGKGRKD